MSLCVLLLEQGWGRTARAKPSGAKRTAADGTGIRANPKAARFRDKKLHDAWARTVGEGHTAVCRWYGTDEHLPIPTASLFGVALVTYPATVLLFCQPCVWSWRRRIFLLCKDLVEHRKSCLY